MITGHQMNGNKICKKNMKIIKILIFLFPHWSFFYDNRNTIMFKVLGLVNYNIQEKIICLDYLCLHQVKSSKHDKVFSNTIFHCFAGVDIPFVFMNLMSCQGFPREQLSTVILTCQSSLVSYYISNVFVIVGKIGDLR